MFSINKPLKNILTETLIISSLPVIAYAITVAYEAGYIIYFNIPIEIISVSTTNIFISISFVISILFIILYYAQGLFLFFGKTIPIPESLKKVIIYQLGPFYLISIVSLLAFGLKQWKEYAVFIGMSFIFTLIYLLPPLFRDNKEINYIESLNSSFEHEEEKFQGSPNLMQNILNSHGIKFQNLSISFFMVFLSIYSAYGLGKKEAIEQEYFYINKNNPEIAYLRFYNDKIISVEYSSSANNRIASIFFEKSPPDEKIQLERRKIGKLKPQDIN